MKLTELKFDEQPLSREDLLSITGGLSASYTVYGTNCSDSGNGVSDCTDGNKD